MVAMATVFAVGLWEGEIAENYTYMYTSCRQEAKTMHQNDFITKEICKNIWVEIAPFGCPQH